MEKVKLPKEVAEAIETLRNPEHGFSNYSITGMMHETRGKMLPEIELINSHMGQGKIHPDNLIEAPVNGYEVEETPKDKVREYAESLKIKHISANGGRNDCSSSYGDELRGCMRTLDKLGIKIEGVSRMNPLNK